MDRITTAKGVFAVAATFCLGGWDALITALIVLIVIDYITGVFAAGMQGKLSSSAGLKGIAKKVFILMIVALAVQIDNVAPTNGTIRSLVIYFFIANEGLSILENAGRAGLPIPDKLTKALEALGEKQNREGFL